MDKPIFPSTPRYEYNSDECPDCLGIPSAMRACATCHGTGRKPSNILPFTATPTTRVPRPSMLTCDCVRTGHLLWGGDATPCPICGGEGKIPQGRAVEIYHLILRHQHELTPLPAEHDTQPTGMTLDSALQHSRYGAYCLIPGKPASVPCFRLYVECITPGQHDRFHVYSQDAARPVSAEVRWLLARDTVLDAIAAKCPDLPSRHAAVWFPLPKEAAFRLAMEAQA